MYVSAPLNPAACLTLNQITAPVRPRGDGGMWDGGLDRAGEGCDV